MSGFGIAGPPPAPSIPGWTHLRTGKVRDLYTNNLNHILLVASDRISAYDWVMPTEIPGKGAVLTQLSLFWFDLLEDIIPNHVVSTDVPDEVEDRAIIVQPLEMFEIECVARGYLTGSGWSEYQQNSAVCGNALPAGLLDGSQLPTSIFTPATKADVGDHDINIDFESAVKIVGADDYVKKSGGFSIKVLIERIRVQLRKLEPKITLQPKNILTVGRLTLDSEQLECAWGGKALPDKLTTTEFKIIYELAKRPGVVKERAYLMNIAYKQDNDIEDRTIDSHVKRIRKKFKKIDPKFSAIETRYGSGYRWNIS